MVTHLYNPCLLKVLLWLLIISADNTPPQALSRWFGVADAGNVRLQFGREHFGAVSTTRASGVMAVCEFTSFLDFVLVILRL